jgi:hypothetical protein
MMQEGIKNFLFGLWFGVGFAISAAVIHCLAALLGAAAK